MTVARNELGIDVSVEELSKRDAARLFGRVCRDELGISAEEFLEAHARGEYPEQWDVAAISRIEFLLPFVK